MTQEEEDKIVHRVAEQMVLATLPLVREAIKSAVDRFPKERDLHWIYRQAFMEGWERGRAPMSGEQYRNERAMIGELAKDAAEKRGWPSS